MNRNKKFKKNNEIQNTNRIHRISPVLYWNKKEGGDNKIKYHNGYSFVLSLYNFQNKNIIQKIIKIVINLLTIKYKIRFILL